MMTRIAIAAVSDVPPGTARRITVGRRVVALFNVAGVFYAVDDRCPHEGGRLSLGTVEVRTVRCPVHGACFELPTGRALEPPAGEAMGPPVDRGVGICPITVIGDEIYLDL